MLTLLRDAAFGIRLLRRNPASTAVAALTLALGIAATTSIFSVIYATYLEPLPYRDADRLVMVWSQFRGRRIPASPADFLDWRGQATAFEDLNAWNGQDVNLSAADRPERITAGPSTPGFLAMLGYGLPVAVGRTFIDEEGTPGRDQVVILTHRLWQQRFGGDAGIVGQTVRIDQKPHTVVGVLGPGPADENQNRLWLPLAFRPEQLNRNFRWLLVMGRLKPGVTIPQANEDMARVTRGLASTYPESNEGWTASVEPFRNNFVSRETKAALWLLLGSVSFLMLIACANVANLLLARGTARQRELAVRASLGASRGAILRQFLTESVVLSILGGAFGVLLAYVVVDVIMALLPPFTLPTEVNVRLDVPVLLFTVAVSMLSGILFGSAPAWQAARADLNETLKGTSGALRGGHERLRRALVVAEFALALTLLTGGGLAVESFFELAHVDLGLRPERLLTFTLPVADGRFDAPEPANAFYGELLERVRALPGVESASVSTGMPLLGMGENEFSVAGRPGEPNRRPRTLQNRVSATYHETLGIRITRGRAFTDQDRPGGVPVAMVNEAFVKQYLLGLDPLAQRIVLTEAALGPQGTRAQVERQIVGVFADVRAGGPRNEIQPTLDVPFWQSPRPRARMAVRTSGDPFTLQQSIAAVVRSMDADLPLGNVRTMDQIVSEGMASDRFNMALFASFAAIALLLAAVGIYGVMSFVVAQRTREIGLRMALGARRGDVIGLVLREGMTTAFAGAVLGSAGAFFVTRAMRGFLPGIATVNAASFAPILLALLGSAFVACLLPARRAVSVDPMIALRHE